jgi:predicted 3-demethylubiquinone-9 3-methyltransferase (glyoxalase superfamily)
MVRKAVAAGGTPYNQPQDHGFMYGHGFQKPRWPYLGIDLHGTKRRRRLRVLMQCLNSTDKRSCRFDTKEYDMMQKITPCLWFDDKAEEAAKFYVSIFKNSKLGNITRYGEAGAEVSGRPKGSVMTATFEIEGQEFVALNGGPHFKFSEAISFMVKCETQKEIDEMWEKLSQGGEKGQCGWLKDKYGLSWQIVVPVLDEMLQDKDVKKSERVMKAILQMSKIDIKTLKQAYEQR